MNSQNYQNSLIAKAVQSIVTNYNSSIAIMDGLLYRQRDTVRMIEFYTNSQYLGGNKDELDREKPFYNIVNGMCDVENAAKDIDTKNVTATSDDGNHYTQSFLISKDLYQWMKATNFAKTLNDMRDTHTRYGSLLVKKCIERDEDGKKQLKIGIPEWKNVITDQIDIHGSPIIECHYMTPTQMLKKTSWENVQEAIANAKSLGFTTRIPVYEVRGEFPVAFFKEMDGKEYSEKDEKTFTRQLYYFAGQYGQPNNMGQQDANTMYSLGQLTPLYWENNTEDVYKYLARKKRAGRGFGVGVVEEGEEAQIGTNDAALMQFRAMEFTSKVIGQTASKKLKGRNMLTEVDNGTILEHEDNRPITPVQLLPSGGLQQYNNLMVQWFTQFERTTSAYSAQRGESPSSRTSAKLQAAVLGQSGSVMSNIREEFGIFVTEIIEDWVLDFLGEELNTEHILSHEFSLSELQEIDRNFAISTANQMAKDEILSGNIVGAEQYAGFMQQADELVKRTKATRFLKVPKDYYKKAQSKITFNITGEQKDRAAAIEALMGIMEMYASNPQIITDPVLTQIFMQLVELSGSGLSPVNLIGAIQERAKQQAEAAQQGQQGSGKISESINFKDLPPDGQRQMAAKVGIDIQPTAQVAQQGAEKMAQPVA